MWSKPDERLRSPLLCSETVKFAHQRLGAKALGLGATLPHPTITNFGQKLHAIEGIRDLITTTGHGGTVFMIVKTIEKVLAETSIQSNGRIGLIGGAGSIGWSTTVAVLEAMHDHRLQLRQANRRSQTACIGSERVCVASSIAEVLRTTNVIVAAVTERIDLDDESLGEIDLNGKVIIDDSQPGSFCRNQVEARGGRLVWVVGGRQRVATSLEMGSIPTASHTTTVILLDYSALHRIRLWPRSGSHRKVSGLRPCSHRASHAQRCTQCGEATCRNRCTGRAISILRPASSFRLAAGWTPHPIAMPPAAST